jgi:hypothetical protein
MDNCTEPRFQQMIHAFEVGLLTEEDRKAFELHLLDCDACSDEVRSFLRFSGPIRHDPDLRPDEKEVESIMSTGRDGRPAATRKDAKSRSWTVRLLTIAAALVVLAVPTYWVTKDADEGVLQKINFGPMRGSSGGIVDLQSGGRVEFSFVLDDASAETIGRVTVLSRSGDVLFVDSSYADFDPSGGGRITLPISGFEEGFYQLIVEDPSGSLAIPKRIYNFRVR